jgi:hypothetical protein
MTYDEIFRDEMKSDAKTITFNDLEEFAAYHPIQEYTGSAGSNLIYNDDFLCRLAEDHGEALMRLLMRQYCDGEGLGRAYDTDQRMYDESAIRNWLARKLESEAERLQQEEFEA